jgi:tetratricopeptide (TPR) repeat protein
MLTRFVASCILAAGVLCAQDLPSIGAWSDAEKLEADLDSQPDNVSIRLNLLRYYTSQAIQFPERVKPLRRHHIVWFIEHRPEHSVLSEWASAIDKSGYSFADPEGFAEAGAAWQKALSAEKIPADVFANAATFYRTEDPERARKLVEEGLRRYPGNSRIAEKKGMLLAYSIAGVKTIDPFVSGASFDDARARSAGARQDRETLEASDDPNLLGGAATYLTRLVNPLHLRNKTAQIAEVEDLVVRLYRRLLEVAPDVSRWRVAFMAAYQSFALATAVPSEKLALLEKALALAATPMQRTSVLPELSQLYLGAGNTAKAAEAANEVLNSDLDQSSWNYGNAIFAANTVLGRLALQRGDNREAARRLLAAGRAPTSPQLGSFGPTDWRLAEGLLAAGDRDSVLAYLDALHGLWKSSNGRLETFAATIRSGGTPNFTGMEQFPKQSYIGRPAPDFRLKDLKGAEVALNEFKGKVVLVDFWATWCGPCREEMPDLDKLHRQLSGKDVVVLALDVNEPLETVAEYIKKEKFALPVLLADGTGVMERYGVHAYPTLFAIDKKGVVADVIVGNNSDNASRLQALIEKTRLGAPPAAPDSAPPPGLSPPRTSEPPAPSATAEDFYRDAIRQRGNKDYTAAVRSLDRALELRPDWLLAIANRADSEVRLKHFEEAIAGFNRAIQLDPKRAASYDARGRAYSDSGNHVQAIPDYTRAIELNPDSTAAYNNRGWAYLETGKLDESLADLNRAIELNPGYTTALFNRAHLFNKRREFANAIADFDAILHLAPADNQAASQKAVAMRMLRDSTPAAAALAAPKLLSPEDDAVIEHFPRDTTVVWAEVPSAAAYMVEWDYRDNLGWASERTGASGSVRTLVPVASFRFVGAQTGRWRVWAVDATGSAGPKSEWREFRYTR